MARSSLVRISSRGVRPSAVLSSVCVSVVLRGMWLKCRGVADSEHWLAFIGQLRINPTSFLPLISRQSRNHAFYLWVNPRCRTRMSLRGHPPLQKATLHEMAKIFPWRAAARFSQPLIAVDNLFWYRCATHLSLGMHRHTVTPN